MFSLKTLPFLLLLHVQISKAFPVSSKEKNTKTVQHKAISEANQMQPPDLGLPSLQN
uniref:Matrix metallopeptidase 8 n=1 Tax=Homo sapiens TaxID=9606 RepID=E9PJB3_HUMAN